MDKGEDIMARAAYAGYGLSTDFKKFDGTPMLHWDKLPANIQDAWKSAAVAAAGAYADLEAKSFEKQASERQGMDTLDCQGLADTAPVGKTAGHCGQAECAQPEPECCGYPDVCGDTANTGGAADEINANPKSTHGEH